MPDWRKPLKNKKRFDARYFLSERRENQEVVENSVQQEQLKKDFHDFSFDSWLMQEEIEEEIEEERDPNYGEPLAELHAAADAIDPRTPDEAEQDAEYWENVRNNEAAKEERAKERAALKKEG